MMRGLELGSLYSDVVVPTDDEIMVVKEYPQSSEWGGSNVPPLAEPHELKEILEPAPFRKGVSLQRLPDTINTFIPMCHENLEKLLESAAEMSDKSSRCRGMSEIQWPEKTCSAGHQKTLPLLTRNETFSIRSSNKVTKSQGLLWEEHFKDLLEFKVSHGHTLVPHTYPERPSFARWAKRQRFQYKLLRNNKPSVMTEERLEKLESIGFIWDPQSLVWESRLLELVEYQKEHGHCDVPCRYAKNPSLGAWVKRQRRQYKRYKSGLPTNISPERFRILSEMGFQWQIQREKASKGRD